MVYYSPFLCIFAVEINKIQSYMKISIISINYNNADGLNKTIESVIDQTYKDFEFIVIDGGSTDGSVDIIKKHTTNISYWISEPDNGIYHAMNKGIKVANGDYCIFINSGDSLYDNKVLQRFNSYNSDKDIIIGRVFSLQTNSALFLPPNRDISLYHLFSSTVPHQGTFIRTSLQKKYPYDESLKIVADWKFFLVAIIMHNCSIEYTEFPVSKYDTGGISSTNSRATQEEKNRVLEQLFPPRLLADYLWLKNSECKTLSLMPEIKKHYRIDLLLYKIGKFLLKILYKHDRC